MSREVRIPTRIRFVSTPIVRPLPLLLCLCATLFATAAGAVERIVYPDGSGSYPTIQSAITASSDGDVVSLAAGDFVQWAISLEGKAITVRALEGPGTARVNGGTVFFMISGEGRDTVVEGITFLRTAWDHSESVNCDESSPTFVDCVFEDAPVWAERSDPRLLRCVFLGGASAMRLVGRCSLSIEECRFEGADYAIEFRRGAGGTSRIVNTTFEDNTGGIFAEDFIGSLDLEGCEFRGNGFGVDVDGTAVGTFTLESCVFEDNQSFGADLRGEENRVLGSTFRAHDTLGDFGGLYLLRGSVEDCLFEGNRARNAGGLAGRNVTVSRCTFRENHAIGFGEGDGFGGAMILEGGSTVVEESLFLGNRAGNGAAIVLSDPTVVRDCTFLPGVLGGTIRPAEVHRREAWKLRPGRAVEFREPSVPGLELFSKFLTH